MSYKAFEACNTMNLHFLIEEIREVEVITEDNYASVYKILVGEIGEEATKKVHKLFKGQQIVFPSKLYSSEYIAKCIVVEHNKGKTVKEIAQITGYTDRRIRQILSNKKK